MRTFDIAIFQHDKLRQFAASVVINILAITTGMAMGWPSPVLPQLTQKDTPVGTAPMTDDEIAWLSSIKSLTGLMALPFCPWSAERFGRKITGLIAAVPLIVNWILVLVASNFYHLLFARIFSGFGIAMTFSLIPIYVSEIADDSIRGILGCFLGFSVNLGTLAAFILGATLSYRDFAICGLVVPLIFVATFVFMPETPTNLIRRGRIEQATGSLMWLRNNDKQIVEKELYKLQENLKEISDMTKSISLKDLFRDRGTTMAFIISMALFCGQHTSGFSIVMIYTTTIFSLSGTSVNPNIASIIIASIQMSGSLLSTFTVERTGRKSLTLISTGGMMIFHLLFGIFFLLKSLEYDVSSVSWIPLVTLSGYVIAYSMGLGPVAYVIVAETFSPDVMSLGFSVAMAGALLVSFGTLQLFPFVSSHLGNYTPFFVLSAFCAATFIFTLIFIPETKGRPKESILEELNGTKRRSPGDKSVSEDL
ncbi:facilitated trehalose transporter Tret1-like [Diachasmimorpha longicaudata]|uniref:facilitated trehalose transporter Tret1-like n=1 Tax=Diachasmimorpha longicaudata TaxID=58733 RepID=UPI0030B8D39B